MPRPIFTFTIDLPLLSPAGRQRFETSVRLECVRELRKNVRTPVRKYISVRTGATKKRFRVGRPGGRSRVGYFQIAQFRYPFYFLFQPEFDRFKLRVNSLMPGILVEATRNALLKEGFNR